MHPRFVLRFFLGAIMTTIVVTGATKTTALHTGHVVATNLRAATASAFTCLDAATAGMIVEIKVTSRIVVRR